MSSFFERIRWPKIILSAVAYTIITVIFIGVQAYLAQIYFRQQIPVTVFPRQNIWALYLAFTLFVGIILAIFYEFVKRLLPKGLWLRSISFTAIIIALSFVFFSLTAYLLLNAPVNFLTALISRRIVVFFVTSIAFQMILG